ncbi:MAG: hypothetical protein ACYCVV_15865, partial [Acidimicrobiales bacterium]
MRIVSRGGAAGRGGFACSARFFGHFDILRLITRGLTRSRRWRSWRRISAVDAVTAAVKSSGGKCRLVGDEAADDPERGDER